jgi:hypothetical protein
MWAWIDLSSGEISARRIIGIYPVEKSRQCGRGLISPVEKSQLAESWSFLQWRNPDNVDVD